MNMVVYVRTGFRDGQLASNNQVGQGAQGIKPLVYIRVVQVLFVLECLFFRRYLFY